MCVCMCMPLLSIHEARGMRDKNDGEFVYPFVAWYVNRVSGVPFTKARSAPPHRRKPRTIPFPTAAWAWSPRRCRMRGTRCYCLRRSLMSTCVLLWLLWSW